MRDLAQEKFLPFKLNKSAIASLQVALGSIFFVLCAKITIPLSPVPISMQTLGILVLAFVLGPKKAFLAIALYLVEASLGMPVLANGINPLWMLGPTCGYLIGFLVSAFVMGKIIEKKKSFFQFLLACFAGEVIIYSLGVSFLGIYLGSISKAVALGAAPFIGVELIKTIFASSVYLLSTKFRSNQT